MSPSGPAMKPSADIDTEYRNLATARRLRPSPGEGDCSTTELSRSGRADVHPRRVRGSIGRVTNETVDVVVVGAGAMGSAAAWALASADRHVVVLEQHALGHDQGGSHGGSRLFRLDYAADGETLASALHAERLWRRIEADGGRPVDRRRRTRARRRVQPARRGESRLRPGRCCPSRSSPPRRRGSVGRSWPSKGPSSTSPGPVG